MYQDKNQIYIMLIWLHQCYHDILCAFKHKLKCYLHFGNLHAHILLNLFSFLFSSFCPSSDTAVTPLLICWRLTRKQSIDSFHRCGRPYRLVANQQGRYDNCARCHMFLNIKRNIFLFMLHILALRYFDTSVTYPKWFRRVKFVLIPPRFVQQQYLWNTAI